MWLIIPDPGFFIISVDNTEAWRINRYKDYYSDVTLCKSLTEGIVVDYCTIFYSRVLMKLNVTDGSNLRSAVFSLANFQNPSTTTPIPNIKTFLTRPDDTLKA